MVAGGLAVDVAGEIEHASATLRQCVSRRRRRHDLSRILQHAQRPGALLSLPMMHKSGNGRRSHFITANFQIADGPAADEIVVAIGAADGGRLHPRIADRFQDMKEIERKLPCSALRKAPLMMFGFENLRTQGATFITSKASNRCPRGESRGFNLSY